MARVVRKVSNKAVSGQKKQKKGIFKSKLFWIIASAVVVIGVTVGIILGVTLNKKDEEVNTVDYFADCEDVEFTIASYSGVKNYTNVNYKDLQTGESLHVTNAFVFAYDLTAFYPDSEEDNYTKAHGDLLSKLIDLQKEIDKQKANGIDVELYIVDISKGINLEILYDSYFGGSSEETDTGIMYLFSYIQNGELADENISIRDKEYKLFATDVNSMITTIVPATINFVKDGLNAE